jgi:hypothetical protein
MARLNECFVLKADAQATRLYNDTGATVYQGELTVLGRMVAIANEEVEAAAIGAFDTQDGKIVRSDDLTTAENTFGTNNQNVYFAPLTGKLSDTPTVGYFLIGQLTESGTKDAAGNIEFVCRRWADLVESDET